MKTEENLVVLQLCLVCRGQGCRQCLGLPLFAGQLHSALTHDRPGQDKVAGKPMLVDKVAARAMSNGVYIQAWKSHFLIVPPLIISNEEIDRGVSLLDEALALADSEVEKKEGYGGYGCE